MQVLCDGFERSSLVPFMLQVFLTGVKWKFVFFENEASILLSPDEYLYSSAMNYAGKPQIMLDAVLLY